MVEPMTIRFPRRLSVAALEATQRKLDLVLAVEPTPQGLLVDASALEAFEPRCLLSTLSWLANTAKRLSFLWVLVVPGTDTGAVLDALEEAAPGLKIRVSPRQSDDRAERSSRRQARALSGRHPAVVGDAAERVPARRAGTSGGLRLDGEGVGR